MSTALAIASVTYVLKDLLNNGFIDHDLGGSVNVSCLPPDKVDMENDNQLQLNLFLYHVTQNTGWQNERYPSLNSSGERISNPPLALNLHYILTAYSNKEFFSEVLLGYGMQLLHENPVLIRDAIRTSLALPSIFDGSGLPANLRVLATSKLADQLEQIRITPVTLNVDEVSKMWTAFQSKYRPSAAYMATVVLIESTRSTKTALPVKARNIYVKPFKQPYIDRIRSQANAGAPVVENQKILKNYRLIIDGNSLKCDNLSINVDGIDLIPDPADVSDTQIIIQLPPDLPAGIHGVQVISRVNMGTPEVLHRGVESNIEAFVLSPFIEVIGVTNLTGTGVSLRSGNINLKIKPSLGVSQRILLMLNQTDNLPGTMPQAYSFQALVPSSPPGPADDIIIPFSGVKAGSYLVRVQVEGAESPLDIIISSPPDPLNKYNSPLVIIT
jgi:hypothetical protein